MKSSFATAINCIDGRTQEALISFVRERFSVDYVDMITEPGPDKILSENIQSNIVDSIRNRVKISIEKHSSKIIVIAGHFDCAGNPVEKDAHLSQIKKAVKNINDWGLGVSVYGVWIDKDRAGIVVGIE